MCTDGLVLAVLLDLELSWSREKLVLANKP